jgi:2'-phosphotransferase
MRFSMQETNGEFYMRANNGHKITKIDTSALMETITIDDVPAAIHGTSIEAWESIKLTGLHPMERNCVQMASGLPDDPLVKSGIRKTSEIYIWVNLAMAIQDGFRFYRSDNGVICSPNVIPSKYFSRVENVKTRELIL